MVLLVLQAGQLDAVILHQAAVAYQHAALVDPADVALAVDGLAVIHLGNHAAVAQHIQEDIPQRGAGLSHDGGGIDDG